MDIIFRIYLGIILGLGLLAIIALERASSARWKEIEKAPPYIICPSYNLGYEIHEKQLCTFPGGGAPILNYKPLFGYYKCLKDAEKQLAHFTRSNVEKPEEK